MRRILPHPVLTLSLLLLWLILTRFSPGHALLGGTIAVIAGIMVARLQPSVPRLRRPVLLLRLFRLVFFDIIRSNIAVAGLILTGGRGGRRRSAFLRIPLELRDPTGLALLAIIVTATPGSAWIEYGARDGVLILHVFDIVDEDIWHGQVKGRYEALLMEIFE